MTFRVFLWHYLWIIPHILVLGIVALLWRHREYKKYPIFFAYLIFEFTQFLVLYPILLIPSATGMAYYVAYSVGGAISVAFHFGLIHEIFAEMSRNYPPLRRLGKPAFRWGTVCFLWLALLTAYFVKPNDPNQLIAGLLVMRRTADILQCGLLMILFAFSSYFGVSWKNHTFGIALGLGVLSTAGLAESALRSHVGEGFIRLLDYGLMVIYHACVLIWLSYLWRPEAVSQFTVKAVPENDLEHWNAELQRLIQQ
jgi:hypothetical protein